jgi:hypothetical protein
MAFVVVGEGSATPGLQRQTRLGAVQGLNLALFIDTEDDRILRWSQIDADDVGEFLNEVGILREFEAARQMGFELMVVPDALNRALADALGFGHGTSAPMGRSFGFVLEGRFDQARNPRLSIRRFASTAGCDIPHRTDTLLGNSVAPQPDGGSLNIESASNLGDGFSAVGQ